MQSPVRVATAAGSSIPNLRSRIAPSTTLKKLDLEEAIPVLPLHVIIEPVLFPMGYGIRGGAGYEASTVKGSLLNPNPAHIIIRI